MSKIIDGEKYLHIWSSSDHHLIHPTTPTIHIINNFELEYSKVKQTVDFIIMAGDLFDRETEASNLDYIRTQYWASRFLYEVHKDKKVLRIIEGTSSHDRGQPEMFENIKPKNSPFIKYINKMCIEYIEELGLNILYVPDNFGRKLKSEIYDDAVKCIKDNNLEQVDIIILHGAMDFQLSIIKDNPYGVYDSEKWSKLAKKFIVTGHVHKPSKKYNIYSSGSFDRLVHGESHPKGSYNFFVNDKNFIAKFQENKNALLYDTIDVEKNDSAATVMQRVDNYLNKNPMTNTNIRIRGGTGSVIEPIIKMYSQSFPQYRFKSLNIDDNIDNNESEETFERLKRITGLRLTEENFEEHYFNFLKTKLEFKSEIDFEYLKELLKEVNGD